MGVFNKFYNKDTSLIRSTIASLLNELNKTCSYTEVIDENTITSVYIPFYYSLSGGEERFLTENFYFDETQDPCNEKATGIYEKVPRGVIWLNGISVLSDSLSQKNIRLSKVEQEDDELKTFSYETTIIPIKLNISAKIKCNNNLDMLRITEALISSYYKNNIFYTDYDGSLIECIVSFPEDYSHERLFEYSFSTEKIFEIEFELEVNTFIPVFHKNSKMKAENVIKEITSTIHINKEQPKINIIQNNIINNVDEPNINIVKNNE
jgi:hypothetical protein